MMHRKEYNIWKKLIARGLVCLFLVNTIFQGISYADLTRPATSTLATNTLGDDIDKEKDLETFLADLADFFLMTYPGAQDVQDAALQAWIARHKEIAEPVIVQSGRRTKDGFDFVVAGEIGPRKFHVAVSEFSPPEGGQAEGVQISKDDLRSRYTSNLDANLRRLETYLPLLNLGQEETDRLEAFLTAWRDREAPAVSENEYTWITQDLLERRLFSARFTASQLEAFPPYGEWFDFGDIVVSSEVTGLAKKAGAIPFGELERLRRSYIENSAATAEQLEDYNSPLAERLFNLYAGNIGDKRLRGILHRLCNGETLGYNDLHHIQDTPLPTYAHHMAEQHYLVVCDQLRRVWQIVRAHRIRYGESPNMTQTAGEITEISQRYKQPGGGLARWFEAVNLMPEDLGLSTPATRFRARMEELRGAVAGFFEERGIAEADRSNPDNWPTVRDLAGLRNIEELMPIFTRGAGNLETRVRRLSSWIRNNSVNPENERIRISSRRREDTQFPDIGESGPFTGQPFREDLSALWKEGVRIEDVLSSELFGKKGMMSRLEKLGKAGYLNTIKTLLEKKPDALIADALKGKYGADAEEAVHQVADEFLRYGHNTGRAAPLKENDPRIREAVGFFRKILGREDVANEIIDLAREGKIHALREKDIPIPIRGHASERYGINIVIGRDTEEDETAALIHEIGVMLGLKHKLNEKLEAAYRKYKDPAVPMDMELADFQEEVWEKIVTAKDRAVRIDTAEELGKPEVERVDVAAAGGTPIEVATDENKQLMIRVLTVLNDHWMMREGYITDPDFPQTLKGVKYTNKSDFQFGFAEGEEEIDENRVHVNEEFVRGLNETSFHLAAAELSNIIYNRMMEGVLVGLSSEERRILNEWEYHTSEWGIDLAIGRDRAPLTRRISAPRGFREAAEEMSDATFRIFIDQIRGELTDIIHDAMGSQTLGEAGPPVCRLVKDRLSGGHEGKIPKDVELLQRTLARAECKRAGFRNYCQYYKFSMTPQEFKKRESRQWPREEGTSQCFGIMTTDIIDRLLNTGLLEEYREIRLSEPAMKQVYGDNPFVLVEDLLEGIPITRESFSSQQRYDQFIDIVIGYKLGIGELGLDILESGEQQRQMMEIVQRGLNKRFEVGEGRNLLPLDVLMLYGRYQPEIHHAYEGDRVRAIGEYIDPLFHTLNALRRLRTDGLPGGRCALRSAVLLHDIGKGYVAPEEYDVRRHEEMGGAAVSRALDSMAGRDFSEDERNLIVLLVATHSAFGIVHGPRHTGTPNAAEIARILQVPPALQNKLSPQMLYILHGRIYEADTSSIANICWRHLPERLQTHPENATAFERSGAARKWLATVRRRFETSVIYHYQNLYSTDAALQKSLAALGIRRSELGPLFRILCHIRGFPGFFIVRKGEDFDAEAAAAVVDRVLKEINPGAAHDVNVLKGFIQQHLVLTDVALASPPPASDITYQYTEDSADVYTNVRQLDFFVLNRGRGHGIEPVPIGPRVLARFQNDWQQFIDPRVLQGTELVSVPDEMMDRFNLGGPSYSYQNRIFIRSSLFRDDQELIEQGRLTGFGRLLIHELTARHLALRRENTVRTVRGPIHFGWRYDGGLQHLGARAVEQQLQMQTLLRHRQELEERLREMEEPGQVFTSTADAPVAVRTVFMDTAFIDGLTEPVVQRVVDAVSRRDLTGVRQSGRSLIIPLSPDEYIRSGGRTFRCIWAKFTTYRGEPPKMEAYVVPAGERLGQPTYIFTMDSSGRLHFTRTPPHPIGGGYQYEAENEFATASVAFWSGFPTAYPIGEGRFIEMSFRGEPVGCVFLAKERQDEVRFGSRLYDMAERAKGLRGRPMAMRDEFQSMFSELARGTELAARDLRRLHQIGITHTHPHHDQYVIYGTDQTRLYDFTNARLIRNMTRDEFIFRVFNDFRSLYYNTYLLSAHGATVQQYEQIMRTFNMRTTPIEQLVNNYFTDEDRRRIGRERLRRATDVRNIIPFLEQNWGPERLEGMTLQELMRRNDVVRIFAEIAGPLYDRLMSTPDVLAAQPELRLTPTVEAVSRRLAVVAEIASVRAEMEDLARAHEEELARIEEQIREARERGEVPSPEDIAMDGASKAQTSADTGAAAGGGLASMEDVYRYIDYANGEERPGAAFDWLVAHVGLVRRSFSSGQRTFEETRLISERLRLGLRERFLAQTYDWGDWVAARTSGDATVNRVGDFLAQINGQVQRSMIPLRQPFISISEEGISGDLWGYPRTCRIGAQVAALSILSAFPEEVRTGRIRIRHARGRMFARTHHEERLEEGIGHDWLIIEINGEPYYFSFTDGIFAWHSDIERSRAYEDAAGAETMERFEREFLQRYESEGFNRIVLCPLREVEHYCRAEQVWDWTGRQDAAEGIGLAAKVFGYADDGLMELILRGLAGLGDSADGKNYLDGVASSIFLPSYREGKVLGIGRALAGHIREALERNRLKEACPLVREMAGLWAAGEGGRADALMLQLEQLVKATPETGSAIPAQRHKPRSGSPAVFAKVTDEWQSLAQIAEGVGVDVVTLEDDFSILAQSGIVEKKGARTKAEFKRASEVAPESLDAAAEYLVYLFAGHRENVNNYTRNARMDGRRELIGALRKKIKEKERLEKKDAEGAYEADARVTRDILDHKLIREGSTYNITPNRRKMSDEAIRLLERMAEEIRNKRGIQIVVNPPVDDDKADTLVFQCTRNGKPYGETHINLHSKGEVRQACLDRTLAILNIGLAASTVPLDLESREGYEDLIGLINRQYALLDLVGGKLIQDNADAGRIREILHQYPICIILPPVEKHEFQRDWELDRQMEMLKQFA